MMKFGTVLLSLFWLTACGGQAEDTDAPTQTLGSNRYLILNDHSESHTVECYETNTATINAGGSEYITCSDWDDCGWWDGTRFKHDGRTFYCDYNIWGWDFRVNSSGNGECHDNC